ncbi:MAG: hypothetical protein ABR529_00715 [Actinomycetota bacterium]
MLQGSVLVALGIVLFVAPEATSGTWPWALTPLTARAIGAWLLGIGVAVAHVLRENDLLRVRPAMVSYAVLGVLQLVALARYTAELDWDRAPAWLYLAFLVSMLVAGLLGWWGGGGRARGLSFVR